MATQGQEPHLVGYPFDYNLSIFLPFRGMKAVECPAIKWNNKEQDSGLIDVGPRVTRVLQTCQHVIGSVCCQQGLLRELQ